MNRPDVLDLVLAEIEREGILLMTDPRAPCVTALVAGEPVRGSWWSHPRGRDIYAIAQDLDGHPQVVSLPLVAGKITFIHRRLWPELLAVATARDEWQLAMLGAQHAAILERIEREGAWSPEPSSIREGSEIVKELERRLLVHGREEHSPTGRHSRPVESWESWSRRVDAPRALADASLARSALESLVAPLAGLIGRTRLLPWQR